MYMKKGLTEAYTARKCQKQVQERQNSATKMKEKVHTIEGSDLSRLAKQRSHGRNTITETRHNLYQIPLKAWLKLPHGSSAAGARLYNSSIFLRISLVNSWVVLLPFMSFVRIFPSEITLYTACDILFACSSNPRCLHIMAALRTIAVGFA